MPIQFPQLIITYAQLAPYFFASFLLTLLFVPLVGKLAYKIKALDMPKHLAGRNERNLEKRISGKVTARLGGLAMFIAIITVASLSRQVNLIHWGIFGGLIILTVVGILDDTFDLSPKYQFLAQFLAALMVVVGGSSITTISIGGEFNSLLNIFSQQFNMLGIVYNFVFPADILTIIWIMAMINFVNWVGGVDGLNGGVSAVAAIAFLLIAMQTGQVELAVLIAVHIGAILGVLPFNYYPSKIFYGFGESLNGFLLAVYAISGNIKFAGSIIILVLPLLDACWVAFTRMRNQSRNDRNLIHILAATLKSDRNHLHHRLLDLGYSWKAVLLIEVIVMSVFATFAFYVSGFSISALQVMIAVIGILSILVIISLARNRVKKIKEAQESLQASLPKVEVNIVNDSNIKKSSAQEEEEKFIY